MRFVRESFLEFGWPCGSRAKLRVAARRGAFGPTYTIPGMVRAKHFKLSAVESALGELTPEKCADALRQYDATRRSRRAAILDCDERDLEIVF